MLYMLMLFACLLLLLLNARRKRFEILIRKLVSFAALPSLLSSTIYTANSS
jgi:hypothetical protein